MNLETAADTVNLNCVHHILRILYTMHHGPGELSEELVTQKKRKKGWRMICDVGEATEGLENER